MKAKYNKIIIPNLIIILLIALYGAINWSADSSADVAKVEISSWSELQEAIDEAEDKNTVYVLADNIKAGDEDKPITIVDGIQITIDLNGKSLDRGLSEEKEDGNVITVDDFGKLKIVDSSDEGEGVITGGNNKNNGGGILVKSNGKLEIKNVTISKNKANKGGGIYLAEKARFTISKSYIKDNEAVKLGGGVYSNGGNIIFDGGLISIKNNTVGSDENDGIYFENFNKMKVNNTFSKNSRIIISMPDIIETLTEGYGEYNSLPANYFFTFKWKNDKYVISDSKEDSEVTIVKDAVKEIEKKVNTVEVYNENGKLITENSYADFRDAWNYCNEDEAGDKVVISMGEDYESDEWLKLTTRTKVVLDLNGHYIKRNRNGEMDDDGCVIWVGERAEFVIKDSNPKSIGYDGIRGGVITGGASDDTAGGIHINYNADVTMKGGTIYECTSREHGGAVYVEGEVDNDRLGKTCFTMTGGKILSCQAIDSVDECHGGAIMVECATAHLKNVTIQNCYSEDDGGAIAIDTSEIIIDNVTFSGNKAIDNGGAVCIMSGSDSSKDSFFSILNCKFSDNTCDGKGGGIFIDDNAEEQKATIIYNCIFKKNSSKKEGGAIFINDDAVGLADVNITENHSDKNGGGVFVDARYDVSLKGKVIIKDNTVKEAGAGIIEDLCLENGTVYTARVIDAGLADGSYVSIGTTKDGAKCLGYDISEYHLKYFHTDKGTIGMEKKNLKKTHMVLSASLITFNNKKVLIVYGIVIFIMIAAAVVISRKGGRKHEK
ncbi:MAG: hypothetical protein K6D02_05170 [Lachnospiraceae bacterium]|nr:hypothetical protein [Lachnospiraceae bacterium]